MMYQNKITPRKRLGFRLLIIVGSMLLLGASCSSNRGPTTTINGTALINTENREIQPTESGCPQEGHIQSPASINEATITFDNQTSADLKVYWIDFNGDRKFYSDLKAQSKYDQPTWVGHVWVVTDGADQCLKLHSANAVAQTLVIN